MLEKVLGVEGSTAAVWVGRTYEGADGEQRISTLSVPSGSFINDGCFSQYTMYQRLNL